MSIIDNRKKREDQANLHLFKISGVNGRIGRDLGDAKRFHQRLRFSFSGTKKHGHISPAKRPVTFLFLIVNLPPFLIKLPHLIGEERGLAPEALHFIAPHRKRLVVIFR